MSETNGWLTKVSVAALFAGVIVCFWELITESPTGRESVFLSTALAVLSMAGSWFASKHYSEQSYNRNLQTFGLKASEKVNNLSNELNKLSVFLQQELASDEDDPIAEALLSKRIKIEAAIHVLGTLKTINEGSLSDWQAVIGDEITEQKEKQEEKEETLREVVDMIKSLPVPTQDRKEQHAPSDGEPATELEKEIASIRSEMRTLATQVSGVPFRSLKLRAPKEKIEKACPRCGKKVEYRQRTRANSVKALACLHCGASLYSRQQDGGFQLQERKLLEEVVACPSCGAQCAILLDPVPGGSTELQCAECRASYRAVRRAKDVAVKRKQTAAEPTAPRQISEDLLDRVREAMGPQPWPHGRSKAVAIKLETSHAIVGQAVEQLVARGDFKLQLNGKLYDPVRPATPAPPKDPA
jgi:hypothetical protein